MYVGRIRANEGSPEEWAVYRTPTPDASCQCSGCPAYSPPRGFAAAWGRLVAAAGALSHAAPFRKDLAAVTAVALQAAFCVGLDGLRDASAAYGAATAEERNATAGDAVRAAAEGLVVTLDELDAVLGTDPDTRLACWLHDAEGWAADGDDAEARLLRWGARNQITMWGPAPGSLLDYARKPWHGLVSQYYKRRWSLMLDEMTAAAAVGGELPTYAPPSVAAFEAAWSGSGDPENATCAGEGDVAALAAAAHAKYAATLQS